MTGGETRKRTKALLLAGGIGSRLRPITAAIPKCLVEIAGRPLLDYWFDALATAGIRDILINTHHLPEPVRRFLAKKTSRGFRTVEFFEPVLLGSAGTVAANPGWADDADDVLIIYADNLSDLDLLDFMAFHRGHGDAFTMLLFHAPNPKACGIAELNDVGCVIGFEEKPAEPKSDLANAGVYAVTATAWREMAAMNAFDLGFDVLPKFVGRMRGYIHDGYHRDIGTIDALNAASREVVLLAGRGGKLKGTKQ
ncbi:nucleotidyltransferase family protein [Sulfuritalea sp.]|uniref:nucleotidyltransferase family protein n=1 Tax=Sulfuritalea sp. TaxID=2480090 RepID=UPI001AD2C216|nr:nucleotidyltransferase family protein [Sulfuritalea sp.]MBN8474896.1 nucleotidyltransferase family protein [Sulfuritalea sp.]